MNPQERQTIDNLFDKLGQAEQQAGPREPLAEAYIRSRVGSQPGAPYLMAQTIVVQEQALDAAQQRLAAVEDELTQRPANGGFLSGLFGGGADSHQPGDTRGAVPTQAGDGARLPGRDFAPAQPGRGGGFLAGAAQTAMGVAGGMFLGSMIAGAFGGGEAQAAQGAEPDRTAGDPVAQQEADGGADFGGDEEI